MNTRQQLIVDIGKTDQQSLAEHSPELALKRAKYRLELISYSEQKQEKIHFLQEAIVILEQARIEFDELPLNLYIDLSILLAQAYLNYYDLQKEQRFATIIQQILKPLAHYHHVDIYYFLAYASAIKKEPALTQHWLKKYLSHEQADLNRISQHTVFSSYQQYDWWHDLIKHKLH